MDNSESFKEHQDFLNRSVEIISNQIKDKEETCEKGIDEVRQLSKYHWEYKSEMDELEKLASRNIINLTASTTNENLSRLRKLRLAKENPFFGKIKVSFDQDDQEDFYIGLISVMNGSDLIINDWRSPIANLFYNSKIGNTSYKAPLGIIDCKLLQREQIKIKDGKIDRIINSDLHITDDELQETLSKSSSEKMKNIVDTIQEEQNNIIRNVKDRNIIVQGCAGSGKTSVALHRLSYLLYNDTNINENNMLIFSPSDTFISYISNVLPDLGDNNVLGTTFSDFADSFVKRVDKIETFSELISKYYDNNITDEEKKLNKYKFSEEYKKTLDKFIQRFVDSYSFKDDLEVYDTFIPMDYLNKLLESFKGQPLQEKIDLLTNDVVKFIKDIDAKKTIVRKTIAKELIKPAFDPVSTYNKFLESSEFIESFGKPGEKINRKLITYPDLIGMLYLNFEFMGYPKNDLIHHLVIDEVQDYSPLQLTMIKKMFEGASITALGDINQTINPYFKYDSLKDIDKSLGNSKYIELNKAYRSSKEIMEYVKMILNDTNIEPVRRDSNNEVLVKDVDKNSLFRTIVSDILTLKENGFERVCIITKSSKELDSIYEVLKDFIDLTVIKEDAKLDKNTFISTSYNAKGLEFDAVISYNDYDDSYSEDDKYLYYVALTRAQHNLIVYNEPKSLRKR